MVVGLLRGRGGVGRGWKGRGEWGKGGEGGGGQLPLGAWPRYGGAKLFRCQIVPVGRG